MARTHFNNDIKAPDFVPSGLVGFTATKVVGALNELKSGSATSAHVHGNITNAGYLGTTANIPLITGTAGIIQAGSFGTGSTNFAAGNHTHISLYNNTAMTDVNTAPADYTLTYHTYTGTVANKPAFANNNANALLSLWSHGAGPYGKQISFGDNEELYMRKISAGAFGTWRKLWHDGNLTPSNGRNFIASGNAGYNISYAGYQRTYARKLTVANNNRIGFCNALSNNALAIIKTAGTYSVAFWYKVENFTVAGTINPDINDTALGAITVSGNVAWTRYTATVYVNTFIGAHGFFDLDITGSTLAGDVYVSDIIVTRSEGAASDWYPAPEDIAGTVTSVTAGNGMTQSGTSTVNPTLDIVSHAGTAGTIGTINVGVDAIGVNLGTTSTTAAAGNHTHNYAGSASAGGAANSVANALTFSTGITVSSGSTYNGSAAITISVTAHNLLSSSHGDTTAASVTRGALITGQLASPKWQTLALPVTPTNKVLTNDGTDIAWSTNALSIGASASVSGSNTGDVSLATNHGLSLSAQVIGMGTPSTLTDATSNSVTTTTHAHAITTYSITGTSPVSASGGKVLGSALTVSLATAYGDTLNPYASKTAKYFLAAPNAADGVPTFRAIVASDIPTLNQSTSGSAGSVANAITFNTTGGAAAGTTYNGSAARTIDYTTIGAAASGHNHSGVYQPVDSGLTSLAGLVYASASFVKMTGADTFTLDTNTYSLSSHTHNYAGSASAGGAANSVANALTFSTGITVSSGTTYNGSAAITVSVSYGSTSTTACVGNDSRLSDARTPTAHTHGNITNTGYLGSTATIPLITGTAGIIQAGSFGTAAGTFCVGNDSRLSDARTPTAHTHGNISNTGTIGSTADLPLKTTTGGAITVGAFGTGATDFAAGNHTHSYQAADAGLTSLAGLIYASASFVKYTGADTFTLDTNSYQVSNSNLTSLAGLSYTAAAVVKMTGANTFALDTSWATKLGLFVPGTAKLTISSSAPGGAAIGDVWIDNG